MATHSTERPWKVVERPVIVHAAGTQLEGELDIPENASGIVLFAHGSGSSRFSPRNRMVARALRGAGFATLLFDLLTPWEEQDDAESGQYRFDISLLARRLIGAVDWVEGLPETSVLPIGLFGASTGAAAALVAAAERPVNVRAVVSRGGRVALAGRALQRVKAPTLLIVGGDDLLVRNENENVMPWITAPRELVVIPGSGHLFEEPGALEEVARVATEWFHHNLTHLSANSWLPHPVEIDTSPTWAAQA